MFKEYDQYLYCCFIGLQFFTNLQQTLIFKINFKVVDFQNATQWLHLEVLLWFLEKAALQDLQYNFFLEKDFRL